MGRKETRYNIIISIIITFLFLTIHEKHSDDYIDLRYETSILTKLRTTDTLEKTNTVRHIQKVHNTDISLSVPYLDKINRHWYVGGSAKIRNTGLITLTSSGGFNKHGVILSNGVGDNNINNFETVYDFSINECHGDGLTFMIAAENGFIWKDLLSSYAQRQYEFNSGGVKPNDYSMMGFSKNLPGLAIVLNTYGNRYEKNDDGIPYLDVILNIDPEKHSYDLASGGSGSTSIRLNNNPIRLSRQVLQGSRIKLKVVYLEVLNFLKIEILLNGQWQNIFMETLKNELELPKNLKTGERYIGISSLSGKRSQTVELYEITTNELHWTNDQDIDESQDRSDVFKQEMIDYIREEYDYRGVHPVSSSSSNESNGYRLRWGYMILVFILLIVVYMVSLYIRVIKKHLMKQRRRHRRDGEKHALLPT